MSDKELLLDTADGNYLKVLKLGSYVFVEPESLLDMLSAYAVTASTVEACNTLLDFHAKLKEVIVHHANHS